MKNFYLTKEITILLVVFLLFVAGTMNAQVGIGILSPHPSAQLDVSSSNKGFLPPRMTQSQREIISSPATGLIVFQIDNEAGFYYYNGSNWEKLVKYADQIKGIPVVITQDDFSSPGLKNYWLTFTSGGGNIQFNSGNVGLGTDVPYNSGSAIAKLYSTIQKSVNEGTLIFTTVSYSYQDNNYAYGPLARGLVNGTSRNNSIEFINIDGSTIQARTVSGGVTTTTNFDVGYEAIAKYYTYTIIASKSTVEFYLDGTRVATHTTNIPTVPLNMYFDASSSSGNVPQIIDNAEFQIIRLIF